MTAPHRRTPAEDNRPLYARALRLRYVAPSGLLCFVFLEGAVALGILLALAELVSWWGVLVLPVLVALMVKLNDVIAGSLSRAAQPTRPRPAGSFAGARSSPGAAAWDEPVWDEPAPGVAEAFEGHREPAVGERQGWDATPSGADDRELSYGGEGRELSYGAEARGFPYGAGDPGLPYGAGDPELAYGVDERGLSYGDVAADDGRVPAEWVDQGRGLPDDATTRLPRVYDRPDGSTPAVRPWAERNEAQQQWLRQSATRRYE